MMELRLASLLFVLAWTASSQPAYPPPYTPECYVALNGNDYRGFQNHTYSGLACQPWDSQSPHAHSITPGAYPDAGLDGNYCRNPDNADFIWCYTADKNVRWQTCALAPPSPYCTPPTCDPKTTCNGQGFCLTDQSCSCFPQYFGTYCDKEITSNGLTDGGLAGVIIGWLLAVPVLACLGFILYQLHMSGTFDGCYDSCGALKDSCFACQCCNRATKSANASAEVEIPMRPAEAKRTPEPSHPHPTTKIDSSTAETTEPPKSSVPDPPDADVLVQQVVDIMQGNITADKARKALRDNGWAMETALTSLLA